YVSASDALHRFRNRCGIQRQCFDEQARGNVDHDWCFSGTCTASRRPERIRFRRLPDLAPVRYIKPAACRYQLTSDFHLAEKTRHQLCGDIDTDDLPDVHDIVCHVHPGLPGMVMVRKRLEYSALHTRSGHLRLCGVDYRNCHPGTERQV